MSATKKLLDECYAALEGSEMAEAYSARHDIHSAAVLTVIDDKAASTIAHFLAPRISGKTVVEIGGGIGMLACHLAHYAKRVFCIEANPAWSWMFLGVLYENKPKNLSYLFGAASEFESLVKADVALFCTHSDVSGMKLAGKMFAREVIDVYGEAIAQAPEKFDWLATRLRALT